MNVNKLVLFTGCVVVRAVLAFVVLKLPPRPKKIWGVCAIVVGSGLLYNFFIKKCKGFAFNQDAWWHPLRPIHATLYFSSAYLAFAQPNLAHTPLILDVIIGWVCFIRYHFA